MAAALPVVATNVGGTPEVIVDGETGLLVDARSAARIADALVSLTNEEDRRRLGARGRSRVLSRFTIPRMVDDYAREYERFLP